MTLEPSDSPAVRSAKQVRAGRLAPQSHPPSSPHLGAPACRLTGDPAL
jgi:hypothetical protein